MLLSQIVQELELSCITSLPDMSAKVEAGYVSDLLSDVLGNAPTGAIWVTMQCHQNVVAVASLLNLPAVILVGNGVNPDDQTVRRAEESRVVLLRSKLSAFETVGRLYQLGIRGLSRDA